MVEQNTPGTLIRKARQRKRLTQVQLAAALGVTKSSVANWERDFHYPLRKAGAIEELLEIVLPEPEAAAS
jgi:DNA-binding transcriptional regulator YiaG